MVVCTPYALRSHAIPINSWQGKHSSWGQHKSLPWNERINKTSSWPIPTPPRTSHIPIFLFFEGDPNKKTTQTGACWGGHDAIHPRNHVVGVGGPLETSGKNMMGSLGPWDDELDSWDMRYVSIVEKVWSLFIRMFCKLLVFTWRWMISTLMCTYTSKWITSTAPAVEISMWPDDLAICFESCPVDVAQ